MYVWLFCVICGVWYLYYCCICMVYGELCVWCLRCLWCVCVVYLESDKWCLLCDVFVVCGASMWCVICLWCVLWSVICDVCYDMYAVCVYVLYNASVRCVICLWYICMCLCGAWYLTCDMCGVSVWCVRYMVYVSVCCVVCLWCLMNVLCLCGVWCVCVSVWCIVCVFTKSLSFPVEQFKRADWVRLICTCIPPLGAAASGFLVVVAEEVWTLKNLKVTGASFCEKEFTLLQSRMASERMLSNLQRAPQLPGVTLRLQQSPQGFFYGLFLTHGRNSVVAWLTYPGLSH